jgi:hypothetical protein
MARDVDKDMALMVDAVQPHCDEPLSAALTCSHAGSMEAVVGRVISGFPTGLARTSDLPNPVFIAVGTDTVYALDYRPRGRKFKIKGEVARWPRKGMQVQSETTKRMCYFTIMTAEGDVYEMEAAIFMGAQPLVDRFIAALSASA